MSSSFGEALKSLLALGTMASGSRIDPLVHPDGGGGRDSGSHLLASHESLTKWYNFAEASLARQPEMVLNSPFVPTIMHRSFVRYDPGTEGTYLCRPPDRPRGFREASTLTDKEAAKKLFRSPVMLQCKQRRLRIGVQGPLYQRPHTAAILWMARPGP